MELGADPGTPASAAAGVGAVNPAGFCWKTCLRIDFRLVMTRAVPGVDGHVEVGGLLAGGERGHLGLGDRRRKLVAAAGLLVDGVPGDELVGLSWPYMPRRCFDDGAAVTDPQVVLLEANDDARTVPSMCPCRFGFRHATPVEDLLADLVVGDGGHGSFSS